MESHGIGKMERFFLLTRYFFCPSKKFHVSNNIVNIFCEILGICLNVASCSLDNQCINKEGLQQNFISAIMNDRRNDPQECQNHCVRSRRGSTRDATQVSLHKEFRKLIYSVVQQNSPGKPASPGGYGLMLLSQASVLWVYLKSIARSLRVFTDPKLNFEYHTKQLVQSRL